MLSRFQPPEAPFSDKPGAGPKRGGENSIPEGRHLIRVRFRQKCPARLVRAKNIGGFKMPVLVLDRKKRPLMPCSWKRARKLMASGRARVVRTDPFTIRLVDRLLEDSVLQPPVCETDPGSAPTGIARVREGKAGDRARRAPVKERSGSRVQSDAVVQAVQSEKKKSED